jgi:hypothetical protein
MGGEFIVLLLLAGAVIGGISGAAFARRSRLHPALRAAFALGIFAIGFAAPLALFAMFGSYVRGTSPQPSVGPAIQSPK